VSVETIPSTDLVVERGRSISLELGPLTTENYLGVKVPIDLTAGGTKMWLTVKVSADDVDPGLVQLTHLAGISLNNPVTPDKNFATALLPASTFADPTVYLDRKILVWDAVWEAGSRHETVARGKLTIVPSVTRAT
jgi:hypothetical protein